ncbi:MAG: hypothetical protein E6I18_09830 [Chloroflexi bacterium]|nr:MAG: hypothetical protein E6I18_09830 [Chloroflexota bacterium]
MLAVEEREHPLEGRERLDVRLCGDPSRGGRGAIGGGAVPSLQREPRLTNPTPRHQVAQLCGLAQLASLADRASRMVDVIAELVEDRAVVYGVGAHQGDPEAKGVAARRVELLLGKVEIRRAHCRVRETVVQRGREAGIEIMSPQRLECVAIHRERLGRTLVREGLREITQLQDATEWTEGGSSGRDRSPVERDGIRPLTTPVRDERAKMEHVTRRSPRKRLRPCDDRLGSLGPAIVEQNATKLERKPRAKSFRRATRGLGLGPGEPESRVLTFAAEQGAPSSGEQQRHAFGRVGDTRQRRVEAIAPLVERSHDPRELGRERALSWSCRHSAP